MDIKSAKYFREKYMTDVRYVKPNSGCNPDYMGTIHKEQDGTIIKGFFDLYHGDKGNIEGFLSGNLKIAEDGQAIYEFMQNAADCDSTAFYMFYNDDYFLAVNNGKAFTEAGMRSILNVGQSDKKSASFIGRFGIGFKLVHRLVGKSDGNYELLHENKGPVLFSWSRKSDLISLINKEDVVPVDNIDDESPLPYFNKILLTNFPANPSEVVKDLSYGDNVVFSDMEYTEMAAQVRLWMEKYLVDDTFNQGSLFFIKLGEGKKALLDKDYKQNLKIGIEYSLNTLKNLKNVKINDTQIDEVTLKLESSVIIKDSDDFIRIAPEYKDSDIHYTIGYNQIDFNHETPFAAVDALKNSPTFYKYFPMGDEMHKSAIFIHCDALSNEANRRKLQEDATNKELLPMIAQFIMDKLEAHKKSGNINGFKQLYANLLLSEMPHDNSNWLKAAFYDRINNYIAANVPNDVGTFAANSVTFIRGIKCDVPLSLVNPSYQWFAWDNLDKLKPLTDAAKEKLNIKIYKLIDFINDVDIATLDQWIANADENTYQVFLNELAAASFSSASMLKLRKIKLFQFSDGKWYSYSDIVTEKDYTTYPYKRYEYSQDNPIIFTTNKTNDISDILRQIGFSVSNRNLDDYQNIVKCFTLPKDTHIFQLILKHSAYNTLSVEQNKVLFLHLISPDSLKKLEGVGDESIKNLCIFKTESGKFLSLNAMVGRSYQTPNWLSPFRICEEDYFKELDKYLISEKNIYAQIIYPHWDTVRVKEDMVAFYKSVRTYYLKDSSNKTLWDKDFVYGDDATFHKTADVIYNVNMLNSSISYPAITNVVSTIFGKHVPDESIVAEMQEAPFYLTNAQLCSLAPSLKEVSSDDVSNFIKLCKLNKEAFFSSFIIKKTDSGFTMTAKSQATSQVYTCLLSVKDFIEKHCSDTMALLPSELSEFSDEPGIVKGEDLYRLILSSVEDTESLREELVSILKYDSKKDFLLKLSSIEIDLDKDISQDDFEYKIIDAACSSLEDKDYDNFRSKITIKKDAVIYKYNQLPSSLKNDVVVEGAKAAFNIDKLLPNEYANASLLATVVEKFSALGLNSQSLNSLLGLSLEVDLDHIYSAIQANYPVLQNGQQLAFVRLMTDKHEKISYDYKLETITLNASKTDFVINDLAFIAKSHVLPAKYSDIGKYITLPYMKNVIIQEPYITEDGEFVSSEICTRGDDGNYDQEKILSYLGFLLKLRKSNSTLFKKVDWSCQDDNLSFSPMRVVYPHNYAVTSETLPAYIEAWAGESDEHLELLIDMGIYTVCNASIIFRKYVAGQISEFDPHTIYAVTDKTVLENSLSWIGTNCQFPLDQSRYEALAIAVQQINKLRGEADEITISDSIDFDSLSDESIQYGEEGYKQWSDECGKKIYLYDGEMPHELTISEYIDEVIYSYHSGNVVDDSKSTIYVNQNTDVQQSMHQLATSNGVGLTSELVYKLFNRSIADLRNEIDRLRTENALLKGGELTHPNESVDMRGSNPNDVDKDDRPEYNEVARKKVMRRLISEGYNFTQGSGNFSIIPGVIDPDGNPSPLVVKSCRWGKLYISPMEWEVLLKPNSMLWIFDGYDTMALPLRNLIRNQEKLVLSMDTRNLDDIEKVSKFAQILQYFKQVNFEFNSVRPTAVASSYKQYAFDDRTMDEKPEADEFE